MSIWEKYHTVRFLGSILAGLAIIFVTVMWPQVPLVISGIALVVGFTVGVWKATE